MEFSQCSGYTFSLMPGHIPSLDEHSLAQLRRYVQTLQHKTNGTLPISQIVGLARDVRAPAGVTIDFRASEELGVPLVVLRISPVAESVAAIEGLSRREAQVCSLVAEGRSNKEIASRLFISIATVKDHVHNILRKLGAPNRAAVAVAYREATHAAVRQNAQ
jgi:DNA-binding CsgD family transcriptional regulator